MTTYPAPVAAATYPAPAAPVVAATYPAPAPPVAAVTYRLCQTAGTVQYQMATKVPVADLDLEQVLSLLTDWKLKDFMCEQ